MLVKGALKSLGAEDTVVHCQNGQALLALLNLSRDHLPKFILLDLHMPVLDGLDALREIRRHPDFLDLPVVLFSSECTDEELQSALALGLFDYKMKPGSFSELRELLRALLERFDLLPQTA